MPAKDFAPTLYSTAISVRNVAKGIKYNIRSDSELEQAIFDASDEIINRLRRAGYFTDVTTVPFCLPILMPPLWEGDHENTGKIRLSGVQVAVSAITEYWLVKFTSTTEFSVSGRFSGPQGVGTTGSNFVTTNGDLTIPSEAWINAAKAGDSVYIPVSTVFAELYRCVSWKAACLIMSGVYTEGTPNTSPGLESICKRAEEMIENMIASKLPNNDILNPQAPSNLEPDRVPYEIDIFGNDVSQRVYEVTRDG